MLNSDTLGHSPLSCAPLSHLHLLPFTNTGSWSTIYFLPEVLPMYRMITSTFMLMAHQTQKPPRALIFLLPMSWRPPSSYPSLCGPQTCIVQHAVSSCQPRQGLPRQQRAPFLWRPTFSDYGRQEHEVLAISAQCKTIRTALIPARLTKALRNPPPIWLFSLANPMSSPLPFIGGDYQQISFTSDSVSVSAFGEYNR